MKDAAMEVLEFVKGKTKGDLENDRILQLAVVKDLEIIGEAASRISTECRDRYPELLWGDMIGMRNRLVHAYYGINLDMVWDTISNDLEPLVALLEKAIANTM